MWRCAFSGSLGTAGHTACSNAQYLLADNAIAGPVQVGTPYPEIVTSAFVQATATGIDIFFVSSTLNNIESMRPADAVRENRFCDSRGV